MSTNSICSFFRLQRELMIKVTSALLLMLFLTHCAQDDIQIGTQAGTDTTTENAIAGVVYSIDSIPSEGVQVTIRTEDYIYGSEHFDAVDTSTVIITETNREGEYAFKEAPEGVFSIEYKKNDAEERETHAFVIEDVEHFVMKVAEDIYLERTYDMTIVPIPKEDGTIIHVVSVYGTGITAEATPGDSLVLKNVPIGKRSFVAYSTILPTMNDTDTVSEKNSNDLNGGLGIVGGEVDSGFGAETKDLQEKNVIPDGISIEGQVRPDDSDEGVNTIFEFSIDFEEGELESYILTID